MSAKKKRTPPAKKAAPVVDRPARERRTVDASRFRLVCQAFFCLFCFVFSFGFHSDFFRLTGELAFFQDTWFYFVDRIGIVGGPVRYVSDFLTSFFLFPAVGVFLLTLLLLLIQMSCARLFRLDGALFPLSFVPSLLLYSAITKTGFLIFADIHVNLLFSNVLGTQLALLCALGYRRIPFPGGRFLYAVIGTYALYYAAGFFGMFGLSLCIMMEFGFPNRQRRTLRIELMFLLGVLAPPLFYRLMLCETGFAMIFFVLLPEISGVLYTYYTFHYALAYLSVLLLGVVWMFRFARIRETADPAAPASSGQRTPLGFALLAVLPMAALVFETVYFAYVWRDLPVVFRMCRLLDDADWEGILRVRDGHSAPLRPIVLIRNLAFFKTGRLGNEALTRPQYSRKHSLLEIVTSTHVCGQRLMYEYGSVNLAYRLSLNHMIMRGSNIFDLKMLARCALANGETALARKYLHVIRRSPFHRRWADQCTAYLDAVAVDPPKFDENTQRLADELAGIRKLIPEENSFLHDRLSLDRYLLNTFLDRDFETASGEVRELILFLLLQQKQIRTFAEYYDLQFRESAGKEMPVHFQEGILVGSRDPETTLEKYRISPKVRKRYLELVLFVEQNDELHRKNPEKFTQLFEDRFGDTYWFFYMGVEGLNAY